MQSVATPAAVRCMRGSVSSMRWRSSTRLGKAGQRIVVRHVGDTRFGALALGDVDHRDQHGRRFFVRQPARVDRDIDQRAVGLEMPPGAPGVVRVAVRQT